MVDVDGNFVIEVLFLLFEGDYSVEVIVIDDVGNLIIVIEDGGNIDIIVFVFMLNL